MNPSYFVCGGYATSSVSSSGNGYYVRDVGGDKRNLFLAGIEHTDGVNAGHELLFVKGINDFPDQQNHNFTTINGQDYENTYSSCNDLKTKVYSDRISHADYIMSATGTCAGMEGMLLS